VKVKLALLQFKSGPGLPAELWPRSTRLFSAAHPRSAAHSGEAPTARAARRHRGRKNTEFGPKRIYREWGGKISTAPPCKMGMTLTAQTFIAEAVSRPVLILFPSPFFRSSPKGHYKPVLLSRCAARAQRENGRRTHTTRQQARRKI